MLFNHDSYVTESWRKSNLFLSEDDIYNNFDKFLDGTYNFLLITGFTGSGKTTLGKQMAEKFGAEFVEMDHFAYSIFNTKKYNLNPLTDKLIIDYKIKHKIKSIDLSLPAIDKSIILDNEFYNFIDYIVHLKNRKVVVEGMQICEYLARKPEARNYPLIIKGTSKYASMFRYVKRDLKWEHIKKIISNFKNFKEFYDNQEMQQDYGRFNILDPIP